MIVSAMLDGHKRMRYLSGVNPHNQLVVSCEDNQTRTVSRQFLPTWLLP